MVNFQIRFLEPAKRFIESLDDKSKTKVLFNLWKSRELNDPGIFKKISGDIWEFRTRYRGKHFRLLAFWDKTDDKTILVIATHGFVKKTQKIAKREIDRAEDLRKKYFEKY